MFCSLDRVSILDSSVHTPLIFQNFFTTLTGQFPFVIPHVYQHLPCAIPKCNPLLANVRKFVGVSPFLGKTQALCKKFNFWQGSKRIPKMCYDCTIILQQWAFFSLNIYISLEGLPQCQPPCMSYEIIIHDPSIYRVVFHPLRTTKNQGQLITAHFGPSKNPTQRTFHLIRYAFERLQGKRSPHPKVFVQINDV